MAVVSNPFEGSFKNLTTKAAKPIKKAVSDAARAVAGDVKEAVMGSNLVEEAGLKEIKPDEKQEIEKKQQLLMTETAANLKKINDEIKKAREERIKKQTQQVRQADQAVQAKKAEEQKRKEDPIWKKMLKGKMGSREAARNAGG